MILNRLKRLLGHTSATKPIKVKKRVLARDAHTVSRKDISENALKVLYRLNKAGFEAYLVGGGVRDVLLGKHPKDFDIATNASPDQVQKVCRNSRAIGRRFKLIHVLFGQDVVEVATFRAANEEAPQTEHGMVLRDNVYGTIEEDAIRRDFTINALYYNIADFSVVDFVGGLDDLKRKTLRLIGNPETRYREDPVRMLRAARLAAKLDFSIEKHTLAPIAELSVLLRNVSHSRLWDECVKMFLTGHALNSYQRLVETGLFTTLFPDASELRASDAAVDALYRLAMHNTDERLRNDKGVNPAFLFAVLLWPVVEDIAQRRMAKGEVAAIATQHAMNDAVDTQHQMTAIAKRYSLTMREMWTMQWRFSQRTAVRAERLFALPRFRAGFDLLALRAQSNTTDKAELVELHQWWETYQEADEEQRAQLFKAVPKQDSGPRKRRPRRSSTRSRKPAGTT